MNTDILHSVKEYAKPSSKAIEPTPLHVLYGFGSLFFSIMSKAIYVACPARIS